VGRIVIVAVVVIVIVAVVAIVIVAVVGCHSFPTLLLGLLLMLYSYCCCCQMRTMAHGLRKRIAKVLRISLVYVFCYHGPHRPHSQDCEGQNLYKDRDINSRFEYRKDRRVRDQKHYGIFLMNE
jgi:hypothetical protein